MGIYPCLYFSLNRRENALFTGAVKVGHRILHDGHPGAAFSHISHALPFTSILSSPAIDVWNIIAGSGKER